MKHKILKYYSANNLSKVQSGYQTIIVNRLNVLHVQYYVNKIKNIKNYKKLNQI